jgi:hypothetical protein
MMRQETREAAAAWVALKREREIFEGWCECARGGLGVEAARSEVDGVRRLYDACGRLLAAVRAEAGSEITCCAKAASEHLGRLLWAAREVLVAELPLSGTGELGVGCDGVRRLEGCFVGAGAIVTEILAKGSPWYFGDE